MKTKTIAGEPSWEFRSKTVQAALTQRGGHLSPVVYHVDGRKLAPFAPSPWASEQPDPALPPILQVLRGDFFCMPFGASDRTFRAEPHPIHGETANAHWTFQSCTTSNGRTWLHTRLATTVRKGTVDKYLMVADGHPAIYSRHVIAGMKGPMNYGHHAILKFPDEPGSGTISTSPFALGQVYDGIFGDPATGAYQSFKPAATFSSLERVPTLFGTPTDASRFPARAGYDDLLMLQSKPKTAIGWTAVTFAKQKYVWFGLKDIATLPGTVMWFSNGGRHGAPWNGRHRNTAGIEEVCSYFATGLPESAGPNAHKKRGFKTAAILDLKKPLTINYIMAATTVPRGFDRVASITPTKNGVRLVSDSGVGKDVPIDVRFLWSGNES